MSQHDDPLLDFTGQAAISNSNDLTVNPLASNNMSGLREVEELITENDLKNLDTKE